MKGHVNNTSDQKRLFERLQDVKKPTKEEGLQERKKIIKELFELNKQIAEKIAKNKESEKLPIEKEDLRQMAYLALMEAIINYNLNFTTNFKCYAKNIILRYITKKIKEVQEKPTENIEAVIDSGKNKEPLDTDRVSFANGLPVVDGIYTLDEDSILLWQMGYSEDIAGRISYITSLKADMEKLFKEVGLTNKQMAVMRLFFGFDGPPKTIKEIAEILKCSQPAVGLIVRFYLPKKIKLANKGIMFIRDNYPEEFPSQEEH